jgi:hypothetical protein
VLDEGTQRLFSGLAPASWSGTRFGSAPISTAIAIISSSHATRSSTLPLSAQSFDLGECLGVGEILRAAGLAFQGDQIVDRRDPYRHTAQVHHHGPAPQLIERHGMLEKEIHHGHTGSIHLVSIEVYHKVDIARGPKMAVKDDGESADDDVATPSIVQVAKQRFQREHGRNIPAAARSAEQQAHRPHGDDVRPRFRRRAAKGKGPGRDGERKPGVVERRERWMGVRG